MDRAPLTARPTERSRVRAPARPEPATSLGLRSAGESLETLVRGDMERRFGYDFSEVRVHRDEGAARVAQAMDARAFTVGSHVVFNRGAFSPATSAGRGLIAHELAHVVQQRAAGSPAGNSLGLDASSSAAEREAAAVGQQCAGGGAEPVALTQSTSAGLIQREPLGGGGLTDGDDGALLWQSYKNSLTLDGFDSDKSELKPDHPSLLADWKARFQGLLARYPESTVSVVGHTDATDTEQHNKALGQDRANAVKDTLTSGDSALPAAIVSAGSLGETVPAVDTKGREARNRRVEIIPRLKAGRRFQLYTPPSGSITRLPNGGQGGGFDNGVGKVPAPPPGQTYQPPKIPDLKLPPHNWFEDGLKKDPLLRELPDWMREKVIDALKDGDEMAAEKIIDALPLDDKAKAVFQAVAKSLLQLAKGKKTTLPETPSRTPDFGPNPGFPSLPGQTIIPGPTWKW